MQYQMKKTWTNIEVTKGFIFTKNVAFFTFLQNILHSLLSGVGPLFLGEVQNCISAQLVIHPAEASKIENWRFRRLLSTLAEEREIKKGNGRWNFLIYVLNKTSTQDYEERNTEEQDYEQLNRTQRDIIIQLHTSVTFK